MRAFVVEEFGKPGSVREVPDPEPGPDQVLVKVSAAGVNPSDWRSSTEYSPSTGWSTASR